jgi:ABC-type bacteriocin/lantibiotic exporter with double-glycine peptidase domain
MKSGWQVRMADALLRERRALTAVILGSASMQALSLGVPLIVKEVVDRLLGVNTGPRLMLLASGAVLWLSLQRAALLWVRDAALRTIETRVSATTLRGLTEGLLRGPLARGTTQAVGERLGALRSGQQVLASIFELALAPALDALLALSALALIAYYLPTVALFLALLCTVSMGLAWRLGGELSALQEEQQHVARGSRARLDELVAGVLTLRISTAEERFVERWHKTFAAALHAADRRLGAALRLDLGYGLFRHLAAALTLILGAQQVLRGGLSIGALLAVLLLQQGFIGAMLPLYTALHRIRLLRGHAQRVKGALLAESSGRAASLATPLARPDTHGSVSEPAIRLSDLWFRYGPSLPWVLREQDVTVPRGACLRLRGSSGAGKTTLLRLMAGLYQPERGEVRLGGRHACEAKGQVLYLSQRTGLFEGTIWSNLVLLSGEAPAERILLAAERTGLLDFCRRLPLGMHTPVSAGGGGLSGGQQQHVVLTACMASLHPVVLLDEPFASLDRLLRARLSPADLFAGRTLIYTDHANRQDGMQEELQGSHTGKETANEGQSIRLSLDALDPD